MYSIIYSLTGVPSSLVLTYKSTLDEILVSWSPVGSDTVCAYNIIVMPSHGMIMMINDTVYNITGLYYNTNYTITVYATNNVGDGEATTVTVKTPPGTNTQINVYYVCMYSHNACQHNFMYNSTYIVRLRLQLLFSIQSPFQHHIMDYTYSFEDFAKPLYIRTKSFRL